MTQIKIPTPLFAGHGGFSDLGRINNTVKNRRPGDAEYFTQMYAPFLQDARTVSHSYYRDNDKKRTILEKHFPERYVPETRKTFSNLDIAEHFRRTVEYARRNILN